MTWEEPKRCASARGWCMLSRREHPDGRHPNFDSLTLQCCGNYCEYESSCGSRGPAGETIHAVAYLLRVSPFGRTTHRLGFAWFDSTADAKSWIERAVRDHIDTLAETCVAS